MYPTTASNQTRLHPPAIALPKGGGTISGIGEKFGANPVTGTGSMTVPLAALGCGCQQPLDLLSDRSTHRFLEKYRGGVTSNL